MSHSDVINLFQKYAVKDDRVQALFSIGSYARKELEPYSDIDLAILSEEHPSLLFKSVLNAFEEQIKYSFQETGQKQVLFIGNQLIKVELNVVKDIDEIKNFYMTSKIIDSNQSILVDKTHSLAEKLPPYPESPSPEDFVKLINTEIDKFLISFEASSSMARREDVFQSYFHYNLSLTRYMRLLQLGMNDKSFLYAPKRIMNRLSTNQYRRVERINGSLKLHELRGKLEQFAIEFKELHSRLYHEKQGIEKTSEDIRNYLSDILDRDLVWNFRDIAWNNPDLVHQGRLFRSSALSRFCGTNAFDKLIDENGIERIIDLRLEWEIDRYPYEGVSIDIQHVPIIINSIDETDENESVLQGPFVNSLQLKSIFELLSERKNTVIACQMGRDRTGWIISIVLLSIGVPIALVEKDFLASQMGITRGDFRKILNFVESKGGLQGLLDEYEVTAELIENVSQWLINDV
jgi:predicted nucleotidyltransferase